MRTLPLCGGNIKDNEIASERGFSGWWEIKQRVQYLPTWQVRPGRIIFCFYSSLSASIWSLTCIIGA
jgi:hypothetical protein